WLLVTGRCAGFSEPVHLHSGASQPSGSRKELGRIPNRSGMAESEERIRSERTTGRSYRSLLHGSDQFFSAQVRVVQTVSNEGSVNLQETANPVRFLPGSEAECQKGNGTGSSREKLSSGTTAFDKDEL